MDKKLIYTKGKVISLTAPFNEDSWLQLSVRASSGNSGSPVLDDSGQAIGMILSTEYLASVYNWTKTLPQNNSCALKAKYIIPLLPFDYILEISAGSDQITDVIENANNAVCIVEAVK